jgi:predicted MFS family arabinose efflux permease
MTLFQQIRPVLPILLGAAVMVSISMGIRQSLGILAPQLTRGIAISMADFTLAIAVLNLSWGCLQAGVGALTVRLGFRPIMLGGSMLYIAGLGLLASAQGLIGVILGAGVCLGAAMACTASSMALSVTSRAVSPKIRSTVLGMVSALGSLGAMVTAPFGQMLSQEWGWRMGAVGFAILALCMIPAAWFASRIDAIAIPRPAGTEIATSSVGTALRSALRHPPFLVMAGAYFICGMQLVFLTTHLPSYLDLCGMDPMLSAQVLSVIGGCNIVGSLFFGWAGSRWNKLMLLGMLYTARSIILAFYFVTPPTPTSTLVFAAMMGFLWLGVGPLIAGSVAEMFGLRWQPMIQGMAFVSHQIGSCVGAFGGGLIYDALGSYTLAWQIGVTLGLTGGLLQIVFALWRPPRPPIAVPA